MHSCTLTHARASIPIYLDFLSVHSIVLSLKINFIICCALHSLVINQNKLCSYSGDSQLLHDCNVRHVTPPSYVVRHAKFIAEVSATRATQTSFIDSEVLCGLIKLIGLQSSMEGSGGDGIFGILFSHNNNDDEDVDDHDGERERRMSSTQSTRNNFSLSIVVALIYMETSYVFDSLPFSIIESILMIISWLRLFGHLQFACARCRLCRDNGESRRWIRKQSSMSTKALFYGRVECERQHGRPATGITANYLFERVYRRQIVCMCGCVWERERDRDGRASGQCQRTVSIAVVCDCLGVCCSCQEPSDNDNIQRRRHGSCADGTNGKWKKVVRVNRKIINYRFAVCAELWVFCVYCFVVNKTEMASTMCRISFIWIDYRSLALASEPLAAGCWRLYSFAFVSSVRMSCWQISYDARTTHFLVFSFRFTRARSVQCCDFHYGTLYEKRSPTINCCCRGQNVWERRMPYRRCESNNKIRKHDTK